MSGPEITPGVEQAFGLLLLVVGIGLAHAGFSAGDPPRVGAAWCCLFVGFLLTFDTVLT